MKHKNSKFLRGKKFLIPHISVHTQVQVFLESILKEKISIKCKIKTLFSAFIVEKVVTNFFDVHMEHHFRIYTLHLIPVLKEGEIKEENGIHKSVR